MKSDHSLDDGELVMVITDREYEEMYYIYETVIQEVHSYSRYPDSRVPSAHNDLFRYINA